MKKFPPKWQDIYPQGTKIGDEEQKFFISISTNTKYEYRSISIMSKETGLSQERIEEIIEKYHKLGMLFQKPDKEDYWAYWERVPNLVPKPYMSIGDKDKKDRIDKIFNKEK